MRRRGTEDDEGSSAKRPASSPLKTRSQRRRLEEESRIQTRSRNRSRAQGAPTMYELAAPTRRKRTVASTSGDLLERLGSIPITADWVQPVSSIDHRATISRAALNWERPTPDRRHSYNPSLDSASSSSLLSLLPPAGSMRADLGATPPIAKPWVSPLHTPDYGDAPNWNDRAPLSRRYSTGHASTAGRYGAAWAPSLLEGSQPVPGERPEFIRETTRRRQFYVPLARLVERDQEADEDCPACFEPLLSAQRVTSPPCGHLMHDKCFRDGHAAAIRNLNKWNEDHGNDPNYDAAAIYDYPCPICQEKTESVADVRSVIDFQTLKYPFDMRYQPE